MGRAPNTHLDSKITVLKTKMPTTKVLVDQAAGFITAVQRCGQETLAGRPYRRFQLAPGNAEALLGVLLIGR